MAAGSPARVDVTLATELLPEPATFSVFLPPGYDRDPSRRYPVLYFLHDARGDRSVLFREGAAASLAREMEAGTLPPFLIVSPDGDGGWFSNSRDGRHRYEDLIRTAIPAEVEKRFRVLPGPGNRGITGISMGGYGAVKIALHHPDFYGSVSSLSGAVIPMSWEAVERVFFLARRQLHRVFGSSPTENSLAENDVWLLVERHDRPKIPFEVFLLGGSEDKYGLGRVALQYAEHLNRNGVRAEGRMEPGTHDWRYWRVSFLEICRWHAARFSG